MKVYSESSIRNVCLLGHGNAGKTSLAEAMLYCSGAVERLGKITEGTTASDFDPEEIKRNVSVATAIVPCEWKNMKLNVIDTPGYFDFVGEVMEGIRVSDGAVIVVSAKSGVSVGTEKAWSYCVKNELPRIIFINKMDDDNANFTKTLEQLREMFGSSIAPFYVPIKENGKFVGYVNIIKMQARKFEDGKIIDTQVPASMVEEVEPVRQMILESVAESDEALMEKYFAGEEFTQEEITKALRSGVYNGSIVPLLCGATSTSSSVRKLMDAVMEYLPAPGEVRTEMATKPGSQDLKKLAANSNDPLAALVFKTIADPYVGKISMFRVYSGTLKADSTIYNATTQTNEKVGRVFILRGKKQIETEKIMAGDIGAITKLVSTNTGDTLCSQNNQFLLSGIDFPDPVLSLAVAPKAKGDEEKISLGLNKLREEDPTIKIENNTETHQTIISGVGELHLDIIVSKLKSKFNVSVDLSEPKVAYRESIKKKVKVEGKHKKQSGGHGQYGHVWVEFEPGEEADLMFEEKVFGGSVPKNYFPAVEKGIRESAQNGVLAGYPVVNLKARLVDGSYHPVDSSEMAFKVAASLAFKAGLPQANPVLLEPINRVEVQVPDSYMGDIIGDINKRRGRILGMNPKEGGLQEVVAEVPASEMMKYATDLRSMTQARGSFSQIFERYEEAPAHIVQKVIEEFKKEA